MINYSDEDGAHAIVELHDANYLDAVCLDDAQEMWKTWPESARRTLAALHARTLWPFKEGEPHAISISECLTAIQNAGSRTVTGHDVRMLSSFQRRRAWLACKYDVAEPVGGNLIAVPAKVLESLVREWYEFLQLEITESGVQAAIMNMTPNMMIWQLVAHRIFIDNTFDVGEAIHVLH